MLDGATPASALSSPSAALTRLAGRSLAMRELGDAATEARGSAARFGYSIGALGLVADARTPVEVIDQFSLASLPGAAPWLAGMINVRGVPVSVIDLGLLLGMGATTSLGRPLVLMLGRDADALGIVLSEPPLGLRQAVALSRPPELPPRLAPFVTGALKAGERIWLEVDIEQLMSSLAHEPSAGPPRTPR